MGEKVGTLIEKRLNCPKNAFLTKLGGENLDYEKIILHGLQVCVLELTLADS